MGGGRKINKQTDIATYLLNQDRAMFSEKSQFLQKHLVFNQICTFFLSYESFEEKDSWSHTDKQPQPSTLSLTKLSIAARAWAFGQAKLSFQGAVNRFTAPISQGGNLARNPHKIIAWALAGPGLPTHLLFCFMHIKA